MPKLVSIISFVLLFSTVELYLLICIGKLIGPDITVLIEVVFGSIGFLSAKYMIKKDSLIIRNMALKANTPFAPVLSIIGVLFGALFLILPGLITDFAGLILMFPFTRNELIKILMLKIKGTALEKTLKEKIKEELAKKKIFQK